jgi:hypothetical protein
MSDDWKQQLLLAHARGDYAPLLQLIPYAGLIGIECSRVGDDLLFRLPANKDNIGNPLLPAIHGGVIAGFMELAAALHLLIFTGAPGAEDHRFSSTTCAPGSFATPGPMPGVPPGPARGQRGHYRLAKHRKRTDRHRPCAFQNR